jgi:beta-galactosidase/beta-glucuronidase
MNLLPRTGRYGAVVFLFSVSTLLGWSPVPGHMMTRYGAAINPDTVWPEYPRPQLVRPSWVNLNGLWNYAVAQEQTTQPAHGGGQILVPFPIESALSGVGQALQPNQILWYEHQFHCTPPKDGARTLLHFEAVNYIAAILVNGKLISEHQGGYDPFTIDITDALVPSGTQDLVVKVVNPTGEGNYSYQPRGKLSLTPGEIFYTDASGIWQTVWLETVPSAYVADLLIVPDLDKQRALVTIQPGGIDGARNGQVTIEVLDDLGKTISTSTAAVGTQISVPIHNPHLWSPNDPYLYGLKITYGSDVVTSYVGMRKVEVRKDTRGTPRIFVNNEPLFLFGPLDQGFWPDGIYLAPTDAALRSDLEYEKTIGCNLVRKHVKVEPQRWYYWADKLGLLVWQDFPSPQDFSQKRGSPDHTRTPDQAAQIEKEMKAMVDTHRNHPCIMLWVVFNEGWGQYDTVRIANLFKSWDSTRLVDDASGWNDFGAGDVLDDHTYPWPKPVPLQPERVSVLGEFGGAGFPVPGHLWNPQGPFSSEHDLPTAATQEPWILSRLETVEDLATKGLSAAIYTQLTDVENEVNGFLTYDRTTGQKVNPDTLQHAVRKLYAP